MTTTPSDPSDSTGASGPGSSGAGSSGAGSSGAPAGSGARYDADRYIAPRNRVDIYFGRAVAWLTRHGVSLLGSRVLKVPGRKTGKIQEVPVNLLSTDGRRYLVAIRGNTQWVRNVRAAGGASLQVGRRVEPVRLVEVPVADRVPVLRLYLARWGWEVSQFIEGISKSSSDADLLAAAPGIPAFEVLPADPAAR